MTSSLAFMFNEGYLSSCDEQAIKVLTGIQHQARLPYVVSPRPISCWPPMGD